MNDRVALGVGLAIAGGLFGGGAVAGYRLSHGDEHGFKEPIGDSTLTKTTSAGWKALALPASIGALGVGVGVAGALRGAGTSGGSSLMITGGAILGVAALVGVGVMVGGMVDQGGRALSRD